MSSCCEWPCPSIVSNATIASSHATSATNRSSHASSARTSRHVRPTSAPGLLVPHLCRDRLASAIPVETDSPTSALGPNASHWCREPHPGSVSVRARLGRAVGRAEGRGSASSPLVALALQTTCAGVVVQCPNGCAAVGYLPRGAMRTHLLKCTEQIVQCPFSDSGCAVRTRGGRRRGYI